MFSIPNRTVQSNQQLSRVKVQSISSLCRRSELYINRNDFNFYLRQGDYVFISIS